jgi:hypothetical protein
MKPLLEHARRRSGSGSHLVGRSGGAQRAVGDGDTEDGDYGVADELLDDSAVQLDRSSHLFEVPRIRPAGEATERAGATP